MKTLFLFHTIIDLVGVLLSVAIFLDFHFLWLFETFTDQMILSSADLGGEVFSDCTFFLHIKLLITGLS